MPSLIDAVATFDAARFADRHGGYKESHSPRSHEYLLPCPCGSSRLRWNATKSGWGAWKCWRCLKSGGTLELVELLEGIDDQDAVAYVLGGYVGGNAPTVLAGVAARKRKPKLTRLPQIAWPTGVDVLSDTPLHEEAWRYLETRGVGRDVLRYWRLGWGRTGWLQGYIVFPAMMDGGLAYWQGRASWDRPEGADRRGYQKTRNPRNIEGYATAEDVLYNYDRASSSGHVVIVEGGFDAIKVGTNAVGLFGKVATPAKIERLKRMRALRYTIYLDRGENEQVQAERLAASLSTFAPTHIAVPPPGFDAGALSIEQNAHVIAHAPRWSGRRLEGVSL